MAQDRFEEVYSQGGFMGPTMKIIVDRNTGVHYLYLQNGNQAASITPLLNPDGIPVVTPVSRYEEE